MGLTIGVDIGGTKIAAGVVDQDGTVINQVKVPTPEDASVAVEAIAEVVQEVRGDREIEAVGLGAPGYVDSGRSKVIFAPNIYWRDEPLKAKTEAATGLPVVVENDANCAAWGEFRFGAGSMYDDVLCITLGTGIGGGIILDRRLHRGRFGVAGEIGHMNMEPGGKLCGCGKYGCWEQYGSGSALRRFGREFAAAHPDRAKALVERGDGTADSVRAFHVTQAAAAGDTASLEILGVWATWVGQGLADLATLFDPAAFILGGGVSESGELVLAPIRRAFREALPGGDERPVAEVLPATMGQIAGIVGAADLARIK
ncbi:glucokinase [Mangrovactinospora gilvigrisea]|uniref:Glucokinase n=1 Tax=Mangrovactinospora gilvigrisea TaxID=1428644 RepID=A0A1J7C7I8_9ACTN|nr:ROK family glucokinase [Mangrovactinospora gilvigrisea]OIV35618.1 glucokinase [Mangrovactinospora gilvigrisea]